MWVLYGKEDLKLVKLTVGIEVYGCFIMAKADDEWLHMAEYKTNERAKEVLEQMFRVIRNGGTAFELPKE